MILHPVTLCEANMVAVDGNADVVLLVEALLSR